MIFLAFDFIRLLVRFCGIFGGNIEAPPKESKRYLYHAIPSFRRVAQLILIHIFAVNSESFLRFVLSVGRDFGGGVQAKVAF